MVKMDFKKICDCLPDVYQVVFILFYFILAYIIYRIVLFGFQRFSGKSLIMTRVIESSRKPFLCILFELALYWSLSFFQFSGGFQRISDGAVFVLTAVTIGWFSVRIAHGVFRYHEKKFNQTDDRSLLTQAIFLYRAVLIVIVMLTLASLLLVFPHILITAESENF